MLAKYIAPVVAVLGLASAQSTTASLCSQSTATISSQADATALASSCTSLTGSLVIASSVAGVIDISGISTIGGSFTVSGASNLTSLSGSQLTSIGKDFVLTELTILSTLSFPSLSKVGTIQWQTLNALSQLSFTTGVTQATSVEISDTQLTSLDGINIKSVGDVNINNNGYLREWSTSIVNITGLFQLSANGPNFAVDFPNLSTVQNMTVANVTSFAIPSLSKVSGSLGFYSNYFETISLPNLTTVGDLTFNANPYLTNISAPSLTSITAGSLSINNNTDLMDIEGFSALKSTGAISISGNFTNITFPALTQDRGAMYLVSSGSFSCTPFQTLKNNKVIQGLLTCKPTTANVQSESNSTSSSSGTSSSGTSKAAAANVKIDTTAMYGAMSVAAIFTVIGGAAGFAQLLL